MRQPLTRLLICALFSTSCVPFVALLLSDFPVSSERYAISTFMTKKLVVATRLHLGQSTEPPKDLESKLNNFKTFCQDLDCIGVIAVDSEPKIPDYSLVETVKELCGNSSLVVLPVQPWGQFVPALNALVTWSSKNLFDQLLLVSAETSASTDIIKVLRSKLDKSTLVVGAVLPGHDYQPGKQALNGRTTPWNTLAIWNLHKLKLTGFQMISDIGTNAGVEEVVAIALLQKLLGEQNCRAKLIKIDGINWNVDFTDPARRDWHERKMKSKVERPDAQLAALHLSGSVFHM